LELALGSVGLDVRWLQRSLADEPAELLGGVELVLLGPRLSAGDREAFVNFVRSSPAKAGIPVLELVTAPYGARAGQENGVDPCRDVAMPDRRPEAKDRSCTALNKAHLQ
jgi:hypothetical protein